MKTQTIRKTPLYKPAVYSKLLGRADISLAVLLQNDVTVSDRSIVVSEHLSTHFGLHFDGIAVFLGVPEKLWDAFQSINWQAYEVNSDEMQLRLLFDVDVEKHVSFTATYGTLSNVVQEAQRLSFVIPCAYPNCSKLAGSSILHIAEMNEHDERTTAPTIPITKITYSQGE
ncbi:hypothetical protein L1D14_20485 [Vibrio tubiashii]|uniref:hypothetical protein n=1 Tax=Vibrio tubiashii TaxID=29498 RepID=UPI001EFDA315|nr:hypothetical protein [Vibrio tubiashii]MCG9578599.1 hypothetical protein [Vibrio tubiashii]